VAKKPFKNFFATDKTDPACSGAGRMEILFDRNTAAVEKKTSPLRGLAWNFSGCKRDGPFCFFEVVFRKRKIYLSVFCP
jgi:hypothetical protein